MQAQANAQAKAIGAAMGKKDLALAEQLKSEVGAMKARLPELDAAASKAEWELTSALEVIPNLPFDEVPVGADEHDNVERHRFGKAPSLSFAPKQHFETGRTARRDGF